MTVIIIVISLIPYILGERMALVITEKCGDIFENLCTTVALGFSYLNH